MDAEELDEGLKPEKERTLDDRSPTQLGSANIYTADAQSILNKASGFIGAYDFTLNPYRGCQYGCSYCYAAAFSPNAKLRQDWGNWVMVKQNAAILLEKELKRWQKKYPKRLPSIYMSSVTDPYQPIEAKQQLTRQLLKVMLEYQPILVIQTRSPMITRDIDLLKDFSHLRINMSIPTGSETVRKDFEPKSPSITARLQAIGKLKHTLPSDENHEIKLSVTMTPLLPTLPKDEFKLFRSLSVVDRVVIQDFHPSNEKSLVASTRKDAIVIKDKYHWWYENKRQSYLDFKNKLLLLEAKGVEIMEGKEGFTYA
jgi:DNA repair photolyase